MSTDLGCSGAQVNVIPAAVSRLTSWKGRHKPCTSWPSPLLPQTSRQTVTSAPLQRFECILRPPGPCSMPYLLSFSWETRPFNGISFPFFPILHRVYEEASPPCSSFLYPSISYLDPRHHVCSYLATCKSWNSCASLLYQFLSHFPTPSILCFIQIEHPS